MPGKPTTLALNLEVGSDADDKDRADLTRRLRKTLLDLSEVDSVDSPAAPAVPRSKAVGVDWHTLVVTLAASGGVLTTLIGSIQAWLTRHERASVTLEIGGDKLVMTGVSPEVQRRLVDDWIVRHGR